MNDIDITHSFYVGVYWNYKLSILPGYFGCNFQYTPALEKECQYTCLESGWIRKYVRFGNLHTPPLDIFRYTPPLVGVILQCLLLALWLFFFMAQAEFVTNHYYSSIMSLQLLEGNASVWLNMELFEHLRRTGVDSNVGKLDISQLPIRCWHHTLGNYLLT